MYTNKILYKKFAVALILLGTMVTSACKKDYLDREPLGRYSEEDIPAGSFDSKVFAAYAVLRTDGFNSLPYLAIHSFRADESQKGSSATDGADQANMYDEFNYVATNGLIATYWTDHYKLINNANDIIKSIEDKGATDPGTLINKAEAKFLRAFAYFDLARTFGRVPKIDFVGTPEELNKPKVNSVDELFTLIDADLREASNVLPLDWDSRYTGRLTKGAALALTARTYLWRQNWAQALTSAKAVIDLGEYDLVTSYGSQFRKAGENGIESIFEIQAFYTQTNDLGIIYSNVQGVRGAGVWDLGWGWNAPTQNLVDEFETGDPRRIETILYSGQTDPLYNETVPPVPTVPQPYWNKKIYTDPADRLSLNNRFGRWMNHRLIRYADVLLMAAEAANEVGGAQNTTNALLWLEKVRARARGNNASLLPAVTTTDKDLLRKAIQHERFVELGMEEQRFYDLVRWGLDVTVLPAAGKTNYQASKRLLPLPQGEIDKSGGVLTQN